MPVATAVVTSVIMPGRDVELVVGDQLEALARQVGAAPWELVFVDDGSTDGTAGVVEAFRGRLPKLVLLRSERGNAYAARNVALTAASGPQIVCCDADDRVPEGWVAGMQRALETCDLVSGPTQYWWPELDRVDSVIRNTARRPHLDFLPFAAGGAFGCRREVLEALDGWDESLRSGGDVDLSWRALLAGYRLGTLPDSLAILYRQRERPGGTLRQHVRQGQAQVLAYRRYRAAGMPRRSLRQAAADWWVVLRKLPGALRSRQMSTWMQRLGVPLGRLAGSIRFRAVYL